MSKEEIKPRPNVPTLAPTIEYKVERKKSTGTRELAVIGDALHEIHNSFLMFMDTVVRSDRKSQEISEALRELKNEVEKALSDEDVERVEAILEDLDERIFCESVFTEKSGKGVMRMTDDTKFKHMQAFATAAARIAATKQKMSGGDYTPTITVIENAQKTLDEAKRFAVSVLGPREGEERMNEFMDTLVRIWS